jgi:tripartite-type tricarboxylate transporter receptor subunit TctC
MQPLQAQIQAGKLRAVAVTTAKRSALLPDLPTIAEAGYPTFEALAWNGILVAAGTPRPIVQRLNAEINTILKDPTVKSALNAQGFELVGGAPEDFAALIKSESDKWAPVIRKTGARID